MARKSIPAHHPARDRSRDDESLLLRSAESLGRMIGSLQRQLEIATGRLGSAKPNGSARKNGTTKRGGVKAKSGATPRTGAAKTPSGGARKKSAARKGVKKR